MPDGRVHMQEHTKQPVGMPAVKVAQQIRTLLQAAQPVLATLVSQVSLVEVRVWRAMLANTQI